jgi:hypothetical protein
LDDAGEGGLSDGPVKRRVVKLGNRCFEKIIDWRFADWSFVGVNMLIYPLKKKTDIISRRTVATVPVTEKIAARAGKSVPVAQRSRVPVSQRWIYECNVTFCLCGGTIP